MQYSYSNWQAKFKFRTYLPKESRKFIYMQSLKLAILFIRLTRGIFTACKVHSVYKQSAENLHKVEQKQTVYVNVLVLCNCLLQTIHIAKCYWSHHVAQSAIKPVLCIRNVSMSPSKCVIVMLISFKRFIILDSLTYRSMLFLPLSDWSVLILGFP